MDEITINQGALYTKMACVMGKLSRLPKNGLNQHFNYKYVTDADVVDAVRTAMSVEGLALFVSMDGVHQEGKHTIANFTLTFADGESGATKSIHWVGEANDTQDKGVAKAATSAIKYALLKTFLISTGDEPDSDGDGPTKEEVVSKKKPKKAIKPNQERGPKAVKVWLLTEADKKATGGRIGPPTIDDIKRLAPALDSILGGDDERHAWTKWTYGKESLKELTGAQTDILWTTLNATYDDGKWTSTNDKFVAAVKAMYQEALKEEPPQEELGNL